MNSTGCKELIDVHDLQETQTMADFTKYCYEFTSRESVLRQFCTYRTAKACCWLNKNGENDWRREWIEFLDIALGSVASCDFFKVMWMYPDNFEASFSEFKAEFKERMLVDEVALL